MKKELSKLSYDTFKKMMIQKNIFLSAKKKSCEHKLEKHYITKGFCQLDIKIVGKKDHYNKTKQNFYFILIKDKQAKYIYSELVEYAVKNGNYKIFKNAIHDFRNVNNLIKKIRTDHTGSFNICDFIKENESFKKLLKDNNIKHQFSILNHTQTNGSIERFYRTINEKFIRHY